MSNAAGDATQRFSNRVEDYVRWRPGYPAEMVERIAEITGVRPGSQVVDLGAGTGISSALFLDAAYEVWAVEPNAAMRAAAETRLSARPGFHSIAAPAESTTLPDQSMDLAIAAQAFHWFDQDRTRGELRRVLRPPGWVALIWNSRRVDGSPFLRGYEDLLLTHGIDYAEVRHEKLDERVREQFFGGPSQSLELTSDQRLDRAGYLGRLRSSSYVPTGDDPRFPAMLDAANRLFDEHAIDGQVTLEYLVQIFVGQIAPAV